MPTTVRIVGQGLAGSLLGWVLERHGIDFRIVDRGSLGTASSIGAGILNPITGRRMVKSAMVDELMPLAKKTYREMESVLGVSLLKKYRMRRIFSDTRERDAAYAKHARGELDPYVSEIDDAGMWVEPVYRLDIAALVRAVRVRWKTCGVLSERVDGEDSFSSDLTIWCVGIDEKAAKRFGFVPFRTSKGEIITVASQAIQQEVILNDGHWVLPTESGFGKIGATYEPNTVDSEPTAHGLKVLSAAAQRLLGSFDAVVDQQCGIRLTTLDKLPVVGRHPCDVNSGICNALGSKGALWAPFLADAWFRNLTRAAKFPPTLDIARFYSNESEDKSRTQAD